MSADPDLIHEALRRSRAAHSAPKRRAWFSDLADRLLFLVFFLGGFGAIFLLKVLGQGTLVGSSFVAFLAAALLIGYAALGWAIPYLRLHADRLGDNCYYLGLLYTLASLAAALMQIELVTAAERGALVERLLASFGVALVSTIVGIALRVFFLQMRREVDDLEEQLQRELTERAMDLKDQMLFAVTELESFRLRTQQVLNERLTEATGRYTAAVTQQVKDVADLSARLMAQFGDAFDAHARNAHNLNEVAIRIGEAGNDLVERVRAVEVPRDLLVRRADSVSLRFDRAGERISEAADDLARRMEAIEMPKDWFGAQSDQLSTSVEQTIATLRNVVVAEEGRLHELGERMATIGQGAARFSATVEALARCAAVLEASVSRLAGLATTLPSGLEVAVRYAEGVGLNAEAARGAAGTDQTLTNSGTR